MKKLLAPDPWEDGFGWSVAVAGDTALVSGAYDDGAYNSGSIHVFKF